MGWSQYRMEEESGYSRNSIINWETGVRVPRADILAELAKLLNTTSAYLVGETDDHLPPAPKAQTAARRDEYTGIMRESSPLLNLAIIFETLKHDGSNMSEEERAAVMSLLTACIHEISNK